MMKTYQKPETVNVETIELDLIAIECASLPGQPGDKEVDPGMGMAPKKTV